MNYFPNNYGTTPYLPNYIQNNVYPTLNGKIVDSFEVAKNQDVPLGSFAVFPTADLGKIFIKTWTNNGTTQVFEYERCVPQTEVVEIPEENMNDYSEILEAISALSKKIDGISKSSPTSMKKTGGGKNE